MLPYLLSAFSVLTNLSKIKAAAQAVYEVITKLVVVLDVINQQVSGTPLAKEVGKYLPIAIKALNTIKDVADKFAPILGVTLSTSAASVGTGAHTELNDAVKALSVHV